MLQEADVEEYWSYCGEIESMDLMRFPDTGRFKGIAFITFKTVTGFSTPSLLSAILANAPTTLSQVRTWCVCPDRGL